MMTAKPTAQDFAADDLPLMLPGRPDMRYDFPKAWHHFKELVKDKENTAEVAKIFEALPWRGAYDAAKAFLASERGQAIRKSEPSLVAILDDHDALRKMPRAAWRTPIATSWKAKAFPPRGWWTSLTAIVRPNSFSMIR